MSAVVEDRIVYRWILAEDGYLWGKATCPVCGKRMKFRARFGPGSERAFCSCGQAALVIIRPRWDWEIYEEGG